MVEERRQHGRLVPSSPMFVSLDESKSGLLLDVCQGGVAVASLIPRNLDDVISLAFELPEGSGKVQAIAEVAWTRDNGHLTGVRFLSVDDLSRQQLCDWIDTGSGLEEAASGTSHSSAAEPIILPVHEDESSRGHEEEARSDRSDQSSALLEEIPEGHGDESGSAIQENPVLEAPVFVTRSTYAQVDSVETERESSEATEETTERSQGVLTAQPSAAEPQVLTELGLSGGSGKSRHTIELILAVVLLSWALVFLGYQMGSTGVGRESAKEAAATAAAKVDDTPSKSLVQSVEASPAPTREAATALTVGDSGMVLQVGAMKLEDNADALAQELQKKNLPAFVFRHGADGLYRVAVGPYSDDEAAAKAKAGLEKQGYKPILRRWLPE